MKKTSNCRATVIIVNWNGKMLLADTLYALQKQTYQSFHTVLVDNGSFDGSVEFVNQEFPHVETIALNWNSGFAYANNIAIKKNGAPYTILLNNDAVPAPTWIECLTRALDRTPQAGFAASKMLYFDNPGLIDRVGDAYTNAGVGKLRGRKMPAGRFSEPEWIFGACAGAAIYRTAALIEVGLFDEDFFLINEDVDLSFRLQSQGYKCLYIPDAIVFHKASSSIVHDSETSVYYGHRNLEWVYIKNLPVAVILQTLPLHIVYVFAAMLFFAMQGHLRIYIKAKIDAMAALSKMLKKRKIIQVSRTVDTRYILTLMTSENFIGRKKIRQ
jgi:GT2 family glycosyltransferase